MLTDRVWAFLRARLRPAFARVATPCDAPSSPLSGRRILAWLAPLTHNMVSHDTAWIVWWYGTEAVRRHGAGANVRSAASREAMTAWFESWSLALEGRIG
jgi:hypothetical protein